MALIGLLPTDAGKALVVNLPTGYSLLYDGYNALNCHPEFSSTMLYYPMRAVADNEI